MEVSSSGAVGSSSITTRLRTMWLTTAGGFLGGAFFPLDLLPSWLRRGAELLPMAPAIEGARMALLRGTTLAELGPQCRALALMSTLTLPAGLLAMGGALRHLRVRGAFSHY